MSKWLLILLLGITSSTCGKEPYHPLAEGKVYYYALIEIPESADLDLYYNALGNKLKLHRGYRLSKIFFASDKLHFFVIRRFEREQEGKKLIRKLKRSPDLPDMELRVVSQSEYRQILEADSSEATN